MSRKPLIWTLSLILLAGFSGLASADDHGRGHGDRGEHRGWTDRGWTNRGWSDRGWSDRGWSDRGGRNDRDWHDRGRWQNNDHGYWRDGGRSYYHRDYGSYRSPWRDNRWGYRDDYRRSWGDDDCDDGWNDRHWRPYHRSGYGYYDGGSGWVDLVFGFPIY